MSNIAVPSFIVDAFASAPFRGNPAGVCLLEEPAPESWMHNVAAELGLSETAFLVPRGTSASLRWFTPTAEVALCGHATLAAAHAWWEHGATGDALEFHTLSGTLRATRSSAGITIELPRTNVFACDLPRDVARALGVDASTCFRTEAIGGLDEWNYLVPIEAEAALRALKPDLKSLAPVVAGFIVTAPAADGSGFDFVSRYFAPYWGIDEDPVTGSAHCALAPYWSERLGRTQMTAHQASRRGGDLEIELGASSVRLTGRAFTVLRGAIS